ncbi:unnamed protein product [Hermetia illucens]|uniref:Hermansky-Pudlak syndrome 5 protein homolog n=1 Tax=Hermetia illucens TaxID=343691 RepID=A0A7R8V6W6_HERIL|nr:Hermansky-Pudlak syndrome 5 protein homolog [Hermetia illucens]CAD7093187.1 unnamed protein product [Hermetia illucens]
MNDIFTLSGFVDLTSLVKEPLKQTCRIKYTCFDASANYIIFGASSGSLYLFSRNPAKFLHLTPSKHGPITLLSISPNERYVAFATSKGAICVYVINLSPNTAPQMTSTNVGDAGVSYLHWSADEKQFYYGTRGGEVHLVSLTLFMGRTLLNLSVHPILFLDSPIVQISDFESLLLVSNYTKCILCNTEYEEYKQIGNRPRDGYFGATFAISPNENLFASRIYCARPGSRLWEVDLEGNVLQTHQFKESLACPPVRIIRNLDEIQQYCDDERDGNEDSNTYPPQILQFPKLQTILSELIFTHTETGVYIFDPRTSSVVLWCNEFNDRITDCKVIGSDIFIFTNLGSLQRVQLNTLQSHAIELVHRQRLLECAQLLKTNLKYFAEKAKEQYDLHILGTIKSYLISNSQYEMLNDLSVIFDSMNQNENDIIATSKRAPTKTKRLNNGVYILENSFCENLKIKPNSDKQLKDALLTVTGRFGKNIIKYKFNIFAEDQKNLVNDLIPIERNNPFKEINEQLENDQDVICDRLRETRKMQEIVPETILSEEQKTVYNLFMIFKSSQISNVNFLDRYSTIFDTYDSREIIELLEKLKEVMVENGDNQVEAKKNCYEMYFNYLNPEIIWEVDDISREFIIDGFVLVNAVELSRCSNCGFPLEFPAKCRFHALGETLVKFLWSRNEQKRCLEILNAVPSIIDTVCRFYMQEGQIAKAISVALSYPDVSLFREAAKSFDIDEWEKCFEIFASIQLGQVSCVNCDNRVMDTEQIDINRYFDWNSFLDVALQYNKSRDVLNLLLKYSNLIPNNAIGRTFFVKCLVNGE